MDVCSVGAEASGLGYSGYQHRLCCLNAPWDEAAYVSSPDVVLSAHITVRPAKSC
jgi:hypothetical protein